MYRKSSVLCVSNCYFLPPSPSLSWWHHASLQMLFIMGMMARLFSIPPPTTTSLPLERKGNYWISFALTSCHTRNAARFSPYESSPFLSAIIVIIWSGGRLCNAFVYFSVHTELQSYCCCLQSCIQNSVGGLLFKKGHRHDRGEISSSVDI